MPFHWLPDVHHCCYCIRNLRTAVTIIAVLGIVTSPLASWAIIRHAYVIRVSCYISTNETKPDVIDINLNNVLSFGFGANAGLGPSCLSKAHETKPPVTAFRFTADQAGQSHAMLKVIMYVGWVVLLGDFIFVLCCLIFLVKMGKDREVNFLKVLIWTCIVAITLTFLYGLMFVVTCLVTGGQFPVFEFIFTIVDLCTWCTWVYYIIVLNSYLHKLDKLIEERNPYRTYNTIVNFDFWSWYYSGRSLIQLVLEWIWR